MTYTAQIWNRMELVSEAGGLTLDQARAIANDLPFAHWTARIMAEGIDWCEVRRAGALPLCGTLAETTFVQV